MSKRWLILAVLFAARTLVGYQYQSVAAVSPFLMADLGIDYGQYGESAVVTPREFKDEHEITSFDQVLVGRNKTRKDYNARMREIYGRSSRFPEPSERMVCLKNDREKKIFNGGMFTVESVTPAPEDKGIHMTVRSQDDPDLPAVDVFTREEIITGARAPHHSELRGTQQFTYGYALTVHKSQGSQWPKVMIKDEAFGSSQERRQWLYTAITRAAEQVVIVR